MSDPMKFIGFDIEITKPIPEGTSDITPFRPLGISCAAAVAPDFSKVFYGKDNAGNITASMSKTEVLDMLAFLNTKVGEGYKIVTWNGLSFDFDVLAEESGDLHLCEIMSRNHIDIMFQFVCMYGYPIGLNAVAKGMGLSGKTEGMHGDLVPFMWNDMNENLASAGRKDLADMSLQEKRNLCLKYVEQDSRSTLEVAQVVSEQKEVRWTAKSGRFNVKRMGNLEVVDRCKDKSLPDTSWMSSPIKRENYYRWWNK